MKMIFTTKSTRIGKGKEFIGDASAIILLGLQITMKKSADATENSSHGISSDAEKFNWKSCLAESIWKSSVNIKSRNFWP